MTKRLTVGKIIRALGGQAKLRAGLAAEVSTVVVDSREAIAGSLFVALRGERQDGHAYVADAFDRGAIAAIVERDPGCGLAVDLRDRDAAAHVELPEFPVCLLVADALAALQQLAAWWRTQFTVRVVAITGSVGKTTTKEFVAAVLSQRYRVLKSQGSLNNEIGLPLTLLELDDDHEYVVLEMGTYGPGEITLLAEIARPHVGVVTNVGPVHLERMGTVERIAQCKSELPRALPEDGVAVLNADDAWVHAMAEVTRAGVFTYGLSAGCDLWADQVESHGLEGVRFWFHRAQPGGADQAVHAHIALLGRHSVHTALRAAAVGLVEGLSWDEILHGLRTGEQLRLLVVPGANGSTLLDDTYNSSPDSAIAALNLLAELEGRKVAVLGDMLELGVYEVEGHNRVGRRVMDVAEILITVGERGALIGRAALEYGMPAEHVIQFATNEEATACLQALVEPDDVILVKGSRGMAMEAIVEALARPPANGAADSTPGER
jgi:UDP-N-acetylmuramoyl-tripeptide--D-alanyl-D-alanine ligase